jgi:CheY-like chemotaxis protein
LSLYVIWPYWGKNTTFVMTQPRVLIADDHHDTRRLIVALLSPYFQVVGDVSDGDELVQSAVHLLPDVIVSDIFMPRMDGLAARNKLLDQGQAVPFVFVSALGKEVVQFVPDHSTVAFVYKGDIVPHLSNAVEAVLVGQRYLSPNYRD